ncbi:hypothetical protein c7_R1333 [Megavirus courdo7]|uniref:Uncharacterized protein n=1 Tax=Megavirus courdo7 TaxID=1128135 RepID=H2ECS2_9VIRU|nr:hypothetical protein c7_R1333 [Megavirus courdo7]
MFVKIANISCQFLENMIIYSKNICKDSNNMMSIFR